MKRITRLTESDLHRIVKESVKKVLNEIGDTERGQYILGRAKQRALYNKECGKETEISNYAWNQREKHPISQKKQLRNAYDQGFEDQWRKYHRFIKHIGKAFGFIRFSCIPTEAILVYIRLHVLVRYIVIATELSILANYAMMFTAIWTNNILLFTFAPTSFNDCIFTSFFVIEVHCHCNEGVEL